MLNRTALTNRVIFSALMALFPAGSVMAADNLNPADLVKMSLAQLSDIEVTSVSKKSENANEAAAAIYVISQDDIAHSGANNIPDVLRQVPGLNVAQSGSHQWSISSRGFNDRFSNKLLVLIDGRTVYTPIFSGVYWDVQDTPLQDIERIEVIRGPGATLWGANAVNGVINIITKHSKDTQGGFVSETAGNQLNSSTTTRYGAKVDDDAYVRLYAKHDDNSSFKSSAGADNKDSWTKTQGGFRSDWKRGESQSFTLQGDAYNASENYLLSLPLAVAPYLKSSKENETNSGLNVLGRWNNKVSSTSDITVQTYFDDAKRNNIIFDTDTRTFDLDMQQVWTPVSGHEVVWGAGYRLITVDSVDTAYLKFSSENLSTSLFSAFVQDKITLMPKEVFLTLGSKFEHNDFTGVEIQPSARISWLIDKKNTAWASVSRAVHTPDFGTQDTTRFVVAPIPSLGGGFLSGRVGNSSSTSEELVVYEVGYRSQLLKNMSVDVSTYYNDYSRLILGARSSTVPVSSPLLGNYSLVTVVPTNAGTASSYGIETSVKWNPLNYMQLAAGYTLMELKFDQADPYGNSVANKSPKSQFDIRSAIQLPHDVEFDTALYYVGTLSPSGVSGIASYPRLDSKLGWKPLDALELSIVGQNLIQHSHKEFIPFLYQTGSEVPRTIYGNITWKF